MTRWPNTAHWQRLVSAFRATHGSRWRTAGAELLSCEKRDLRALVDRDMNPADIKLLDALLIDHLHQYAADLRRRAGDICNVARSVMRASNEVGQHYEIEIPVVFDTDAPPVDVAYDDTPWARAVAALLEDA